MTGCSVAGIRSIDFGVADLENSTRFYTGLWGLERVAADSDTVFLRGTGADHHVLALRACERSMLLGIDLTVPDRAAVEALHGAVRRAAMTVSAAPGAVEEPGGGYGFSFRDPEGRSLRIIADAARHAASLDATDRPSRIAHVVLNSADIDASSAFYLEVLGFAVRERSPMMNFLRCNEDHHSIAFFKAADSTLNHVAFVMNDVPAILGGAARLEEGGFALEWGIGQHGSGEPVFAYFVGPDDAVIEYTTEVDAGWTCPPAARKYWNRAKAPTERFKAAQKRVVWASGLQPVA